MSRFLNPAYHSLDAYTPGEQPKDTVYTKLNTNESPYPAGPKTVQAVCDETAAANLRLYSDPDSTQLKSALAERYQLKPENVFVSNGSDDILNFAFLSFGQDGVAMPAISYGFYPVFADLHHLEAERIPLEEDFSIDPGKFRNKGKMVVIANPNAPTGLTITLDDIASICESDPDHVVLIDEAYVDFGAESCLPLIGKYKNLLVVQTFSKSRSLAGARLGFAFADPELIGDLERIKYSTNPYNVNSITSRAGVAALSEDDYYRGNAGKIMEERRRTTEELTALGFQVIPSLANFIFVTSPDIDGGELYQKLKECRILIRHFSDPAIAQYNRITIGTPEEMDILLEAIRAIIAERGES